MSKNQDNPFAILKASQFPDARKKSRAHPALTKLERGKNPADDEDELFVLAMSRVEKLEPKESGEKGKTPNREKKQKNTSSSRPDSVKSAVNTEGPTSSVVPAGPSEKERKDLKSGSPDTVEQEEYSAFAGLAGIWKKDRSLPQCAPAESGGPLPLDDISSKSLQQRPAPALPASEQAPPNEAEELDVFFSAMNNITPLPGKGRSVRPEPLVPHSRPAASSNPLQDIVDGKVEFTLSGTDEFMEGHVIGLDLLTVGKLQAGRFSPEAHIDLHGLNSEQAFHNLVGFFRNAYYKGTRTALVVTGRGLNSPDGNPVLRGKMRQWFTQDPFRRIILAFCTARREDGGTGALYVLLRKYRKNSGKIHWETVPADPDLFR